LPNHPELRDFVEDFFLWFSRWAEAVQASSPTFADSITLSTPAVRNLTLAELEKVVSRLRLITDREYGHTERMRRPVAHAAVTAGQMQQAVISRLTHTYEPPGILRDGGPRHDNDSTDIQDIRIAPTHGELLCPIAPYLPVFLPMGPHHLPENSMQRHLDIQFRLLREEMMYAPIAVFLFSYADRLCLVRPSGNQLEKFMGTLRPCGLRECHRRSVPRHWRSYWHLREAHIGHLASIPYSFTFILSFGSHR
jgi:hypothetical protein